MMPKNRCVECELTVMPRPFMVCDECAKQNDIANRRMASAHNAKAPVNIKVNWGTYTVSKKEEKK